MSRVLIPGSFDPIHNGHLEVIEIAAGLFGDVIVAAVRNPGKDPLFSLEEREAMLVDSVAHLANVQVTLFSGLVVQIAKELDVDFILKGLRSVSDFETEMQMAQMNQAVADVRTLFVPTSADYGFLASRFIREISIMGGSVAGMVPAPVAKRLQERFGR
ncbi:MAG: pantetheine-phosphate adenylyltransferase [Acidimicrobiales bacterium]